MSVSKRAALALIATLTTPLTGTLGTTGCLSHECTAAACSAGFDVVVDGGEDPQDLLVGDALVIEAIVDGGTFELACSFAMDGSGTCGEGTWHTPPDSGVDAHVRVTVADEFDPGSAGQVILLHFEGIRNGNQIGPEEVAITVSRDGVEVASDAFAPEYTIHEDFNGEGCGDCAFGGGERLHVPPP